MGTWMVFVSGLVSKSETKCVGEFNTKIHHRQGEIYYVSFSDVDVIENPVRFCYWKPYERASGIQTDFLGAGKGAGKD